jgi:hypothetical protein
VAHAAVHVAVDVTSATAAASLQSLVPNPPENDDVSPSS